ncbi:ester cyclase [Baekduia soli]|uniref:Ester cyclase n=1 Tax=Baekduia soli TaxID=496014 RepID=A0A5B8U1T3_9ACTN|nr:ester cyclase [Baekduia soli]QEC46956.1 ester cyclase [Baekduia soli]
MSRADDLLDTFQAALVGRDRAVFPTVCALDVHYEDPFTEAPVRGCEALADHVARLWVAAPDARVLRAGERLTDGRFVATPVRFEGTHSGELPGLPATRRAFGVHAMLFCELDPPRERLWRVRAFFDLYDTCVQLGILPTHGGLGEKALWMLRGFGLRARS